MILYTENNIKLYCTKCGEPKLTVKGINAFDFVKCIVDGGMIKFYFSLKNNASNFYFKYNGFWYRTPIVTEEFDVMDYIEKDEFGYFATQKIEDGYYMK